MDTNHPIMVITNGLLLSWLTTKTVDVHSKIVMEERELEKSRLYLRGSSSRKQHPETGTVPAVPSTFENSNYVTVLHILRHIQFSTWHQPLLQQLWYQTHYAQTERRRGKKLGAVDKYRLRRRHPLPRTIWDGEETVYCFKQSVRHILQQYFLENKYPNPEEKFTLAKATGLSCTQKPKSLIFGIGNEHILSSKNTLICIQSCFSWETYRSQLNLSFAMFFFN
ncbi:Homeobox protein six4 [Clonorchis sinensis]|uniref:Homeobox protein six4 n=1 Tax=Clonorchis sinensis TaxID=79923 RepID=A0A419Q8G7_CLOSI|nr:Homeobox protein six4 [Clonorchis sinensis]